MNVVRGTSTPDRGHPLPSIPRNVWDQPIMVYFESTYITWNILLPAGLEIEQRGLKLSQPCFVDRKGTAPSFVTTNGGSSRPSPAQNLAGSSWTFDVYRLGTRSEKTLFSKGGHAFRRSGNPCLCEVRCFSKVGIRFDYPPAVCMHVCICSSFHYDLYVYLFNSKSCTRPGGVSQ